MKGGFVLLLGVVFIILVMILLMVIFVCTSPGNVKTAYCEPFSPVVNLFVNSFMSIR